MLTAVAPTAMAADLLLDFRQPATLMKATLHLKLQIQLKPVSRFFLPPADFNDKIRLRPLNLAADGKAQLPSIFTIYI